MSFACEVTSEQTTKPLEHVLWTDKSKMHISTRDTSELEGIFCPAIKMSNNPCTKHKNMDMLCKFYLF